MSNFDINRPWQNEDNNKNLNKVEQNQKPEKTAEITELSFEAMETIAGGLAKVKWSL
jgi:hypothetical protein